MKLSLQWFCIVIFAIILRKSSAEIPGCDFQDTVNISNAETQNDEYVYDGLRISADLIGEYTSVQLINGSTVPVPRHLRACICRLRTCVRFCCVMENSTAPDECSDGLTEEIAREKPFLNLYHMNENNMSVTTKKQYLHSDLTVLRTQTLGCEVHVIPQNEFMMFADGDLLVAIPKMRLTKSDYCLYHKQSFATFPMSLRIVINECKTNDYEYEVEDSLVISNTAEMHDIPESKTTYSYSTSVFPPVLKIISIVLLILTLAVYVSVKKLRNLVGKCLFSSLLCLSIVSLIGVLEDFKVLGSISSLTDYSLFFFTMSYNMWESVISFCLWRNLRSNISEESQYGFKFFTALVWSAVAILTGAIFLMDEASGWSWMSLAGFLECSMTISKRCLYYQVPILILSTFNLVMIILTANYLLKARNQGKDVVEEEEALSHPIFDSQNYKVFFPLSTLMCISWILSLLSVLRQVSEPVQHVYFVMDYFESILGMITFGLLILRRSTLSHLLNSPGIGSGDNDMLRY
ncbi:probable G-protein coupled receptor Mth-like 7 [Drosophila biarmipes]|uniref:probable G-protein coupled receptor Mth-like 7 n=1 Tax=Drosophila biarmipes TaxID=125945 RepID=UPI0007E61A9B|nr:probable G-protein coupled receptor Mth-like 7 [Drosophila biarmipes]